ncbi:complex I intermediate-associated protein 30-domain-containing protein [Zopfochytrium polystomum]|nr:complex I intermediate-associated protein 30-domain-containing protein [Zopfochytrium polystomum]
MTQRTLLPIAVAALLLLLLLRSTQPAAAAAAGSGSRSDGLTLAGSPWFGDRRYLFGGDAPWDVTRWSAVDDRVRGGASESRLTPLPNNVAVTFSGTLNTTVLGGAGFASQRTLAACNLTGYAGIEIVVLAVDERTYALNLFNAVGERFPNGTAKPSVEYKYSFSKRDAFDALPRSLADAGGSTGETLLFRAPFATAFPPTVRGRAAPALPPLDPAHVVAASLMVQSYFGAQPEGPFEMTVAVVAAYK